jgi:hypothetical protein
MTTELEILPYVVWVIGIAVAIFIAPFLTLGLMKAGSAWWRTLTHLMKGD